MTFLLSGPKRGRDTDRKAVNVRVWLCVLNELLAPQNVNEATAVRHKQVVASVPESSYTTAYYVFVTRFSSSLLLDRYLVSLYRTAQQAEQVFETERRLHGGRFPDMSFRQKVYVALRDVAKLRQYTEEGRSFIWPEAITSIADYEWLERNKFNPLEDRIAVSTFSELEYWDARGVKPDRIMWKEMSDADLLSTFTKFDDLTYYEPTFERLVKLGITEIAAGSRLYVTSLSIDFARTYPVGTLMVFARGRMWEDNYTGAKFSAVFDSFEETGVTSISVLRVVQSKRVLWRVLSEVKLSKMFRIFGRTGIDELFTGMTPDIMSKLVIDYERLPFADFLWFLGRFFDRDPIFNLVARQFFHHSFDFTDSQLIQILGLSPDIARFVRQAFEAFPRIRLPGSVIDYLISRNAGLKYLVITPETFYANWAKVSPHLSNAEMRELARTLASFDTRLLIQRSLMWERTFGR